MKLLSGIACRRNTVSVSLSPKGNGLFNIKQHTADKFTMTVTLMTTEVLMFCFASAVVVLHSRNIWWLVFL